MDNVTHSLAAMIVAECAIAFRSRHAGRTAPRAAFFATSIAANNLPDADFLYRGITPGKLGYLLHHRGHTHTVIGAAVLGVLTTFIARWAVRRGDRDVRPEDLRAIGWLAMIGPFLHVALDFQNSYGVHPFWPLNDAWFYGDSIFIVEPLFWAAAIPPLIALAETRVARAILGFLILGAAAASVWNRAASPGTLPFLLAVASSSALVASRARRFRHLVAAGGWIAVTVIFVGAGLFTSRRASTSIERLFETTRVVDYIRTPAPGNPLCWSVLAIGTDGDRYVARKTTASAFPSLTPRGWCTTFDRSEPLERRTAAGNPDAIEWSLVFDAPLAELRALSETRCDVRAFLRFSRAPFWVEGDGASVGDLRFSRNRALAFSEIALRDGSEACPRWVPPWTPPRADLLGPAAFP